MALACVIASLVAQTGAASPVAHAAAFSPCDISGKQQDLGASYVTALKVQGVSCTKAERVIHRGAERPIRRHRQVQQGI